MKKDKKKIAVGRKFFAQLDSLHKKMVSHSARQIRKLPPVVVRILLGVDIAMFVNPLWAWWLLYRHKGKAYPVREFVFIYVRSMHFCWEHMLMSFKNKTTGYWRVDWFSPPQSETVMTGEIQLSPERACGTCKKCCLTYWLSQDKQFSCPLLVEHGCGAYKGIAWDYSNCGPPRSRESIEACQCPRFPSVNQQLEPVRDTVSIKNEPP